MKRVQSSGLREVYTRTRTLAHTRSAYECSCVILHSELFRARLRNRFSQTFLVVLGVWVQEYCTDDKSSRHVTDPLCWKNKRREANADRQNTDTGFSSN